jgi:hypothetical protein
MGGVIGSSGGGGSSLGSTAASYVVLPPIEAGAGSSDPNSYLTGYTPGIVINPGGQVSASSVQNKYVTSTVQTCVPAVPAVPAIPARTQVDNHTGWNAGAHSFAALTGDIRFDFQMPLEPVGIICGLGDGNPVRSYGRASHAFLRVRNVTSILEKGVIVAQSVAIGAPESALLSIRRVGGVVTYLIDSEVVYRSKSGSSGYVYADATLYEAGDYVFSPVFAQDNAASVSIDMRLIARGYEDGALVGVGVDAPLFGVFAQVRSLDGVRFNTPVPVLLASDHAYNGIVISRPVPLLYAANDGPAVESNGVGMRRPPPVFGALSLVGSLNSFDGRLPPPVILASDEGSAGVGMQWPLTGYRSGAWENFDAADEAGDSDITMIGDRWMIDFPFVLIAMDGLDVGDTADILVFADADARDFLSLDNYSSISGVMEMLANSGLAINDDVNSASRTALQYAVNVLTGALTEYEGFDFTHFVRCGGETYGCKPDGLYRLRGETDDGEYIRSIVDLGTLDLNDPQLKRIDNAFVGVDTDGEVYLRVAAGKDIERTYKVVGEDVTRRAVMAKGVSARQWSVKLEIVDATSAKLDFLEMPVGITARKFRGRQR